MKCEFCHKKIDTKKEYLELNHFEKKDKIKLINYFHIVCYRDAIFKRSQELVNQNLQGLYSQAGKILNTLGVKAGMLPEYRLT